MNPFFSIIVPTHNRASRLRSALKSIIAQSFADYNVLIVNDGSNKGLEEYEKIKSEFAYPNFIFIDQANSGAASARNLGILRSNGKFICFLDDDDEYLNNHLQSLHNKIIEERCTVAIYHTLAKICDGRVSETQGYTTKSSNSTLANLYENILVPSCVGVHREILQTHMFNTKVPIGEDYELWTRILLDFPLYVITIPTVLYNVHGDSISNQSNETVHLKHIQLFKSVFSIPGVKEQLPLSIRATILSKRHRWLANSQSKNLKFFRALISRAIAAYYHILAQNKR